VVESRSGQKEHKLQWDISQAVEQGVHLLLVDRQKEIIIPMDEQDQFELPETQEFITDAEELQKAAAGPDIHCPYCETRNPAGSTVCKQCGGSLVEGEVRASGHVVGAPPKPQAAPRPAAPTQAAKRPWYLRAAGLAVLLLVCYLLVMGLVAGAYA